MTTPPVLGPCAPWVTGAEVAACCDASVGSDTSVFDSAALAASEVLWLLSGKQFAGQCEEQKVRPFADGCGCWGSWLTFPASSGVPQLPFGYSWGWWGVSAGWGWGFEGCGGVLGCGPVSRALLPNFPVGVVSEVKIDGTVIDPSGYRVDEWRWLTRLADTDGTARFWPSCQRLDLPDTEAGTWSVTYASGQDPPQTGKYAATELACEIYKSCAGQECRLPAGATRVTRQGVQVELPPFRAWALKQGAWATGLPMVDMFLSATNPSGGRQRATVWSPDLPVFAERLGAGSGE